MKSARSWWVAYCDYPTPLPCLVAVLLDVVETLLLLVYSTENEHRFISRTAGMSVSSLNFPCNIFRRHPNMMSQVKNIQIIEGDRTIPASKNHHIRSISFRSMSEPEFWIRKIVHILSLQALADLIGELLTLDVSPLVLLYR